MTTPQLMLPVKARPRQPMTEYQKERAAALDALNRIRRQERRRWIVSIWKALRPGRGDYMKPSSSRASSDIMSMPHCGSHTS